MTAKRIHVKTKNDLFETLLSVSFFAALYFLLYQVQVKVLSDFDFLPMASILLFVMAAIVSLTSSLVTQLYFFGLHDPQYPVLKGIWSMTIGDLSGIFLSLAFVVAMRRVFARRTRTN